MFNLLVGEHSTGRHESNEISVCSGLGLNFVFAIFFCNLEFEFICYSIKILGEYFASFLVFYETV